MKRYEGPEDLPHVTAILEDSATSLLLSLNDGRQLEVPAGRKAAILPSMGSDDEALLVLDLGAGDSSTVYPLADGMFEAIGSSLRWAAGKLAHKQFVTA